MPLSDVQIRNAKGTEKPYKLADFAGLFLLVKPSGSRLWQMKYRFDGKEKLLSFGAYPAVSLVQARARRDDARSLLANGSDPGLIKQEQKALQREVGERTFGRLADELLAKMAKEGKSDATLRKVEWLLRLAKDDIGNRPITDIKPPEVLKCLRKVEDKGNHESARRLRATIGSVFRFAVAKGVAENDPTFALQGALIRPTVKPRAAITDPVQLGGLLRAVDGFNGQTTTRIGLQLLALLVPRPGELRAARWSEFDLDGAVWSIPGERMKMRRDHRIPLPAQALNYLRKLKDLTGSGELLLPSLVTPLRPISENTLNVALRRMGYSNDVMTSHGFRATFSTLANESGLWNPDAIERALAHVEGNSMRRAYARGEHWDERVRMADWWAGFLDATRAG